MDYNISFREKDNGIQAIVQYKSNGKWKQKSKQGFENSRAGKKKAKAWADKMLQDLKSTCDLETNEFEDITFGEYSIMHMKHLKIHLQQGSYRNFETILMRFKDLNDKKLTEIKTNHIQSIVDDLLSRGIKTSTIKDYLGKMNVMFKAAIDKYNIITNNPVSKITIKSSTETNKIQVVSKYESTEILKALDGSEFYYITLIALKSGLRIGEILGLTWDDIDSKNSTITVNKQWKEISKNTYDFGSLKTKNSNRMVPIPKSLLKELLEYKDKSIIQFNNRLFSYTNTASVTAMLSAKYKKLGYDISIHNFRHTYATNLIGNGLDFKTTAKLLGHTVEMTMKTYSHVNDDMLLKATKIISENF